MGETSNHMKRKPLLLALFAVVVIGAMLVSSFVVVDETEFVVVTEFGRKTMVYGHKRRACISNGPGARRFASIAG